MQANISIRLPADKIDKIKARGGNKAFSGTVEQILKEYITSMDVQSAKNKPAQTQTSVCIDVGLAQRLKEVSDTTGVTVTNLIRLAVEKAEKDGTI